MTDLTIFIKNFMFKKPTKYCVIRIHTQSTFVDSWIKDLFAFLKNSFLKRKE